MLTKKKSRNVAAKITKAIIDETVVIDTLSTTCMYFYQPKVPTGINKFKKQKNDK
jgi:cyclic lactone autoinducer peptide